MIPEVFASITKKLCDCLLVLLFSVGCRRFFCSLLIAVVVGRCMMDTFKFTVRPE